MIGLLNSRPQCLRVWECARKLWETLRRSSQNLAIWASQRMLFDPTKTFSFFYIYFIAKVLGIQGSCGSCRENTVKRSQSQI